MRTNKRYSIVTGLLLIANLVLGWFAHQYARFPGDLPLSLFVQSIQNRPLLATMETVSYVIDSWRGTMVVIIIALVFWLAVGALEGGMVLLAGLFASANEIFKVMVDRHRPTPDLVKVVIVEGGKSFPSGHSFFAVAVLGFTAYLMVQHQTRRRMKIITISLSIILILLIGVSRIYLGAHWASDVVGGYLVGAMFLVLEIWIYQRLTLYFGAKKQ